MNPSLLIPATLIPTHNLSRVYVLQAGCCPQWVNETDTHADNNISERGEVKHANTSFLPLYFAMRVERGALEESKASVRLELTTSQSNHQAITADSLCTVLNSFPGSIVPMASINMFSSATVKTRQTEIYDILTSSGLEE